MLQTNVPYLYHTIQSINHILHCNKSVFGTSGSVLLYGSPEMLSETSIFWPDLEISLIDIYYIIEISAFNFHLHHYKLQAFSCTLQAGQASDPIAVT